MLLLVKLQALACNITENNTPSYFLIVTLFRNLSVISTFQRTLKHLLQHFMCHCTLFFWNLQDFFSSLASNQRGKDTETQANICSKSTIKTLEQCANYVRTNMLTIKTHKRRQWRRSGVFIVSLEHISQLLLMLLLFLWTGICLMVGLLLI